MISQGNRVTAKQEDWELAGLWDCEATREFAKLVGKNGLEEEGTRK